MGNRTSVPTAAQGGSAAERWQFEGGFTLDLASRTLSDASGSEVPLWRSEFTLLATLLGAPGRATANNAPRYPAESLSYQLQLTLSPGY